MARSPHRRLVRRTLHVLLATALVAGIAVTTPLVSAQAIEQVSSLWELSPAAASDRAVAYQPVRVDLSAAGVLLRVATSTDAVRVQTVDSHSARVGSALDLSDRLDTVDDAFGFVNYDLADRPMELMLRGTKAGVAVVVRVTSTSGSAIVDPAVATVPVSESFDPARLALLDTASSGMLAVHRDTDGSYRAQRLSFAMEPVGDATTLPLAAVSSRSFAMATSSGNIVSTRDGAVDVVSIYATDTVVSTEVPGLGASTRMTAHDSTTVLVDADGTVAVADIQFGGATTLRSQTQVPGGVLGFAVGTQLDELQVVPGSADRVLRSALTDGSPRAAVELGGLRVVPGSLLNGGTWDPATTLVAEVDGAPFDYRMAFRSRPVVSATGDLFASSRGAGVDFAFAARGTGSLSDGWEYSLDSGASWAARDAEWATAVPDHGDVSVLPDALPAPLDGRAPFLRQEAAESGLAPVALSRSEYAVPLADAGYDALWRVRVGNELGSVASTPKRIVIEDAGGGSPAPGVRRHPAPALTVAGEAASFTAEASGTPTPTVRWERSADGIAWTPIADATDTTLSFATALVDDGALIRAVFTNASGSAASQPARLRVVDVPAPPVGAAPVGARVVSAAELGLDLSAYSHEWRREIGSRTVSTRAAGGFTFAEGHGWVDRRTGEAQIGWSGAASYRPYAGLNGIRISVANPSLAVSADRRATLTADVFWNNGGGMGGGGESSDSGSFRRVLLATFADVDVAVDADGGPMLRIAGAPEWADRPYVKPGLGDATVFGSSFPASFVDFLDDALRPWFLSTGSFRDPEKGMLPIAVTATIGTATASTSGDRVDPLDPLRAGATPFARSAPIVTAHPSDATATAGGSAEFIATGKGNPEPGVTWQRRAADGAWHDVPGATSRTVLLDDLAEGEHPVRAVFANTMGSTATNTAVLTVSAVPASPGVGVPSHGSVDVAPGVDLPQTGASPIPPAMWALGGGLVAAGLLMVLLVRRRPGAGSSATGRAQPSDSSAS